MTNPTPEAVNAVAAVLDQAAPKRWRHDDPTTSQSRAADVLAFIRDAIHRDGPDADAIRETLGLTQKWGVRYERDGGPTMDNPSGIDTADLQVLNEDTARQAVKNRAPIGGRNHRIARRVVGEWQEVQS